VNLLITMTLGGLWHGAAWNFLLWGLLHGGALVVERASEHLVRAVPRRPWRVIRWLLTMVVVLVGWYLFRARSPEVILATVRALADLNWTPVHTASAVALLALAVPVLLMEWCEIRANDRFVALRLGRWPAAAFSAILVVASVAMSGHHRSDFIYFQF